MDTTTTRAVRVALPGLFADRFDDTQLAHDLRRDGSLPTTHDEYTLSEVWRTGRRVKRGRGTSFVIDATPDDMRSLIDYAEAFENAASQNEEASEARACRVAIDRLRDAIHAFNAFHRED
jgi:hypothetical protein